MSSLLHNNLLCTKICWLVSLVNYLWWSVAPVFLELCSVQKIGGLYNVHLRLWKYTISTINISKIPTQKKDFCVISAFDFRATWNLKHAAATLWFLKIHDKDSTNWHTDNQLQGFGNSVIPFEDPNCDLELFSLPLLCFIHEIILSWFIKFILKLYSLQLK